VHLKVDTGMHRVGCDPEDALELAELVVSHPELRLEGVWTHCAVADEPDDPFTGEQLRRFDAVLSRLRTAGVTVPIAHAANSAAALAHPDSRRDLVRCGIAVYGVAPGPEVAPLAAALRPALSLRARVSWVKVVRAGEGVSYGLRHRPARDTLVATVPVGYADGVPRRLFEVGGAALVHGRRCPVVGAVTMDQLMLDCGPAADPSTPAVARGAAVVLIGEQAGEEVTADDWAERLGTIAYEIVTSIGPRLPRRYRGR
jgi:alanine racemase